MNLIQPGEILLLSRDDVNSLVTTDEVLRAVEEAFKLHFEGRSVQPEKTTICYGDGGRYRLNSLPCYVEGKGGGVKWIANNSDNRNRGLPTIAALIVLNDDTTSMPICLMEGSRITALRTAGHAGVAAKYLANNGSDTMGIVGCGVEGRAHLEVISSIFRIREVKVYDLYEHLAEKCAAEIRDKWKLNVLVVDSAKEAAKEADIVCTTTTSSRPVLMADDISKGTFVAGTALFRDLDARLIKKVDKWVLGDRRSDLPKLRETQNLIELSEDDVYAELGEIITGLKLGREKEEEKILFSHAGMGILDIMTGLLVYNKAIDRGVGLKINLLE
jgi:ornithine cyclodeaminase/alanine dehydrogenase-like protein (mu-crystallin family)